MSALSPAVAVAPEASADCTNASQDPIHDAVSSLSPLSENGEAKQRQEDDATPGMNAITPEENLHPITDIVPSLASIATQSLTPNQREIAPQAYHPGVLTDTVPSLSVLASTAALSLAPQQALKDHHSMTDNVPPLSVLASAAAAPNNTPSLSPKLEPENLHPVTESVPSLSALASTAAQSLPPDQSSMSEPVPSSLSSVASSSSDPGMGTRSFKRKRSSRRSKKKSSPRPAVPGSVTGTSAPLFEEGPSHSSTDQVQSEIQAIDSILAALNTGDYSLSNMASLSSLTGGASNTSQTAQNVAGEVAHAKVKPVDSIQSYDSRLDSTSSDSCSSTESSDESVNIGLSDNGISQDREGGKERQGTFVPKSKGETFYMDLPLVEPCKIPFPENGKLLPVATVSHYTEKLLVVSSLPITPPVDEGTVLWTKDKTSIAKVFETFGPVRKPFYSIRINSIADMPALGVAIGDTVFVIPDDPTHTKYVFPGELMKQKGSDASWKDDNEVPAQFWDYSDDENEQRVRGSRKKGKAKAGGAGEGTKSVRRQPSVKYSKDPRMQQYFPRAANPIPPPQPLFRPPVYPPYPAVPLPPAPFRQPSPYPAVYPYPLLPSLGVLPPHVPPGEIQQPRVSRVPAHRPHYGPPASGPIRPFIPPYGHLPPP